MLVLRSEQAGVTLVEMVIGLAIIAVLFALGAPAFTNWIQSSQIRTAAETIQNGLQLARGEAVRRNTSVQFSVGVDGTSAWTVGCTIPVADLDGDGMADCPGDIQTRSAAEGSVNAVILAHEAVAATGLDAATPVFSGTIVFNSTGRVSPTTLAAGNNAIFDVSNPIGGACALVLGPMRCLRVFVSSGGQIRMCDLALPAGNPQGC